MKLFHIPLLGMYIHHRRKPPTVTGRKASFEEIHTFDRFIIERGEKAPDMVHLIDRISVDQEKISIRIATSDIQT